MSWGSVGGEIMGYFINWIHLPHVINFSHSPLGVVTIGEGEWDFPIVSWVFPT